APAEPLPEGASDPDQEPTLDLNDELAIVRAVSNRQSQTADPEAVAGMTKHDGVYDFDTSSPADTDMLYEMLAGFQEDSVNIYEGLATPVLDAASHPEV
ncbi:MAG TPA: DNA-binding protein, partial [Cutibacterium acnes]|nr:DNA-binding protein [Cutibacterium acnes]